MKEIFLNSYFAISIVIAMLDAVLATKSFLKRNRMGFCLGLACVGAAVVDVSYLISILDGSYRIMSIMSSIYFVTIDFCLLTLLIFTAHFVQWKTSKFDRLAMKLFIAYAAFELVVFAINPFWEIAIHYVPRDTYIAKYSYEMHLLYKLHLVYTYTLVIVVVMLLLHKQLRIPREYRAQYEIAIIGILGVVAINAVFLYLPGETMLSLLDISICGYSLTAVVLYWSCFCYSSHGMLNRLKTSIFENIGQGIVLFDYDDRLILHNARADALLQGLDSEKCSTLDAFARCYDLPTAAEGRGDCVSLQCYVENGAAKRPLRCDVRSLRNEKGHRLGQLYVFSDAVLETDLLTGFQNWESFLLLAEGDADAFPCPTAVAICDINGLSVINSTWGNQAGDQLIQQLAETMRRYFPKHSYFVRGLDANLIALCGNSNEQQMQAHMSMVKESFSGKLQFAVSATTPLCPDVVQAVNTAGMAMRAKKLLDDESMHSEMIASLIQTLQECDSDTEHHVRRTQMLGAALGNQIGLTDIEQSKLSLLCLLHDIGKIGIPLEILNKPGRLTEEEWLIMQSHTEKGYEIANSNNALKGIANEIRHHHERWDGKGYPDGLSRESIPLLSRVIAVVDAYDAMTNSRAYQYAASSQTAMEELKRCAGTQFDPYIVSEFLRMLKENPPIALRSEGEKQQGRKEPKLSLGNVCGNAETGNRVHSVPFSRYVLDETMHIISVDENFERLTGYSAGDIHQMHLRQEDLIPESDRIEYLCHTNASLAKNPTVFQEHSLCRKDGSVIYVFCLGRAYFDSAARSMRSEIIISDVTKTHSLKMLLSAEQERAQIRLKQWEETYRRDSLTGLLNHAAFRSDVEQMLLEGGSRILMLMLDVDKFKQYNDTYGHHNGDKYLIVVAQALSAALGEQDRACRMGGDEFAAVVSFEKDADEAVMLARAQQIFDKVAITVRGVEGSTGVSMGAAVADPGASFNQLYERADKALYRAKENGRSRLETA